MNIPQELLYTKDHEWARVEADGTIVMGITDFAQDSLGGVVYVELPAAGTEVREGASMGQVESTKSVSELYSPVTGEIVEKNTELDTQPELINTDPYGAGWMVKIRPASSDRGHLMDAAAYAEHVAASGH